jgi:hypothetical protein
MNPQPSPRLLRIDELTQLPKNRAKASLIFANGSWLTNCSCAVVNLPSTAALVLRVVST